jgi:hypothetical protein
MAPGVAGGISRWMNVPPEYFSSSGTCEVNYERRESLSPKPMWSRVLFLLEHLEERILVRDVLLRLRMTH